jgi:CHAT domain-containing protein
LASLLRAQENVPTLRKEKLQLALFAVEHARDLSGILPRLHNAKAEITNIIHAANQMNVSVNNNAASSPATVAQVTKSLETADVVHLACHGLQNSGVADVLSSCFALSDGRLTVAHLMDLELTHAFCAFLSACETAKGDKEQPEQVVHLAAAMLFVGFRSVVGTMWYVN